MLNPTPIRRNRRPKSRELFCPAHPEERIWGNGRKYFLHLLRPEELRERGMSDKKARLVIQAHPVLVLSNESSQNETELASTYLFLSTWDIRQ